MSLLLDRSHSHIFEPAFGVSSTNLTKHSRLTARFYIYTVEMKLVSDPKREGPPILNAKGEEYLGHLGKEMLYFSTSLGEEQKLRCPSSKRLQSVDLGSRNWNVKMKMKEENLCSDDSLKEGSVLVALAMALIPSKALSHRQKTTTQNGLIH